jgi:hypothetical protein
MFLMWHVIHSFLFAALLIDLIAPQDGWSSTTIGIGLAGSLFLLFENLYQWYMATRKTKPNW